MNKYHKKKAATRCKALVLVTLLALFLIISAVTPVIASGIERPVRQNSRVDESENEPPGTAKLNPSLPGHYASHSPSSD